MKCHFLQAIIWFKVNNNNNSNNNNKRKISGRIVITKFYIIHTHTHTRIYIYIYIEREREREKERERTILQIAHNLRFHVFSVGRMFANGPGDRGSIPCQVIPKTQKKKSTCCRFA